MPRESKPAGQHASYAATMEDPNELIKVTLWLPRYAKRALKEECARRDMTMGTIALEALTRRIVFYEKKEGETK